VVYGLDAQPLVLEAELLVAALLALRFALWLLGGRRRLAYETGPVADDHRRRDGGVLGGDPEAFSLQQVGAAAPSTRAREKGAGFILASAAATTVVAAASSASAREFRETAEASAAAALPQRPVLATGDAPETACGRATRLTACASYGGKGRLAARLTIAAVY
jgi:hypothetical protein